MLGFMSETTSTSEPATGPVATTTPPPSAPPPPAYIGPERDTRRSRLSAVALWVGVVAGIVFIVAVIFFSGFILGRHSTGGGYERGHEPMMFHRGGPPPVPVFPMGPRGQFERPPFGPGGPGQAGPGGPGQGSSGAQPQPPQSPGAPSTTTPPRP